jgi:HD-GYP domain-containing protein (c-di-GMP phosphodiesterase class II)
VLVGIVSIDTIEPAEGRQVGGTEEVMADVIHRLRVVACMAGEARRRELDRVIRADALLSRDLLESKDPRRIAFALMRICDRLGFEGVEHARRLARWQRMLGGVAGIGEAEMAHLELGAWVHDIGKLGVAADVLADDDALTATELDWIRMHSSLGHAILAGMPGLEIARDLVLNHHEYWDGSGYPEGRRAEAIPRAARVFGIVDSYEAMIRTDTAYREPIEHEAAREEILRLAGVRYDPDLVALFARLDRGAWRAVADCDPDTLAA